MALLTVGAQYSGSGAPTAVAGQVGDQYKDTSTTGALYVCVTAGSPGTWQLVGSGSYLQAANNLSDVGSASTSRTNLGLGTSATKAASNASLSNVSSVAPGTVANTFPYFSDTNGTIANSMYNAGNFCQTSNNLSDLTNAGSARTNLGLGTAATKTASNNGLTNLSSVSGATVAGHIAVFSDTAGTIEDGGLPTDLPYPALGGGMLANLDYTTINTTLVTLLPASTTYNYYVTDIVIYVNSAVTGNNIHLTLTDGAGPVIATLNAAGLTTGAYTTLTQLVDAGDATLGPQFWSVISNAPIIVGATPAALTGGNINIQVVVAADPV